MIGSVRPRGPANKNDGFYGSTVLMLTGPCPAPSSHSGCAPQPVTGMDGATPAIS